MDDCAGSDDDIGDALKAAEVGDELVDDEAADMGFACSACCACWLSCIGGMVAGGVLLEVLRDGE